MPKEIRVKQLYQKYIDHTCSDVELEELFDLLREKDHLGSIRPILRQNWDDGERLKELSSLDWDTFLKRTGQNDLSTIKPFVRKRQWMVSLSIAAGLLLILGVAAWFWMHREVIIMYETGYGEVKEIVLNDNSHVRLNANSKILWDDNWQYRKHRNVSIEGEAFFDVTHQDGNQFLVKTHDLTVKVTGTKFNVASRREETKVYLESGKVFLHLHPGAEKAASDHDQETLPERTLEMIPGDQLTYSSTTREIEQQDNRTIEQAASWKTGSLIFKNIPLKTVLQELSDVYGKSFVVRDSGLFEKKVDAAYPYSDWETVMKLMKFTLNAEMTEIKNEVTIK